MQNHKGLFISFEGIDGSGKSTQISLLKEHLDDLGIETIVTREPGGTTISRTFRSILLDNESNINYLTEALLYAADRAEHVAKVIKPALAEGKVVISDRYIDSSLAYQGKVRGLGIDKVLEINKFATKGLFPAITFLLDMEPALTRLEKRGTPPDRIEGEGKIFQQEVANAYLEIAKLYNDRIVILDATLPQNELNEKIISRIVPKLKQLFAS